MVYGVRSDISGTRHHLDIGEDINVQRHFPEGWYDGEEESMYPKDSAVQPPIDTAEKTPNKNSKLRLRRRRITRRVRHGIWKILVFEKLRKYILVRNYILLSKPCTFGWLFVAVDGYLFRMGSFPLASWYQLSLKVTNIHVWVHAWKWDCVLGDTCS